MTPTETGTSLLRFGVFELDSKAGELRKNGVLVKLAPQPLQVLRLLAEHAGEIQTREQIQSRIWGDGTFVDFERGLNVCMAQVRSALNDDAESPRFIQTVPRRGYRFIAPVEAAGPPPRVARQQSRLATIVVALACVLAAAAYFVWLRHPLQLSARIMVAMLPFDDLSGAGSDDPFIEGLTEEAISQLGASHAGRLGVIARTSVMRYRGARKGIDTIGRELKVDYAVEGTVRREGGRIRVTARLIQVSDQAQVWSETYEREAGSSFEMQQDAATRIAAAIIARLFPDSRSHSPIFHTQNREAQEAYRKGRYLEHKGNRDDLVRSGAAFEEAVKLDPSFAEAHAALADACVRLAKSGGQTFSQAKQAATRSLELDESSAEAHAALANVLFWHDWKRSEAERHFRRAIELNPSLVWAQHDYAWLLVATGRTEAGLAALSRALELDPLSPRVNVDAGWLLLQARKFARAAEQSKRTLEIEPTLAEPHACLSAAYLHQGNYKGARDELLFLLPDSPLKREVAAPDPKQGIERYYRARPGSDPYTAAARLAFLGEKGQAIDALERAYASRSIGVALLKTDPALDSLRSEEKFVALVNKLGWQ